MMSRSTAGVLAALVLVAWGHPHAAARMEEPDATLRRFASDCRLRRGRDPGASGCGTRPDALAMSRPEDGGVQPTDRVLLWRRTEALLAALEWLRALVEAASTPGEVLGFILSEENGLTFVQIRN